jgi:hypothetical protein
MHVVTAQRNEKPSGSNVAHANGLADELNRALLILESGNAADSFAKRLAQLRSRLLKNRLQLAILGQFKRGKSTFVNALLGAPILPTAVVPLTAVATFIEWGPEPAVRISFNDGREDESYRSGDSEAIRDYLSRFVAEEQNPQNRLKVRRAEITYPAPILKNGTTLIDTPGVGSTLEHNSKAAMDLLPECDAALFVVSVDPPITEIELAYLKDVKARGVRLFFILNKLDYLETAEQNVVIEFFRRVLSDRLMIDRTVPIFGVSARNGLAAKQHNDHGELERSGIAAIEDHLFKFLATEKFDSLRSAIRRKAVDILAEAQAETELRIHALSMPIEDLAAKAQSFETALDSIKERRLITSDLLAGDRRRLIAQLEDRIRDLRHEASAEFASVVDKALAGSDLAAGERLAQQILATAIEAHFETARERMTATFVKEVTKILAMQQQRLDDLVDSVRAAAGELFKVTFGPQRERDLFELGNDPYWVTGKIDITLLPNLGRVIDHVVPLAVRRSRLRRRMMKQADDLVVRNAENLRWAILQGIEQTLRQANGRLDERLDQAISAIKAIIEEALARRQSQSIVVGTEISRLRRLAGELVSISSELRSGHSANPSASSLPPEA